MNAEGQAFFRRLDEYLVLLRENRRIERAVKGLSVEVEEAERKYAEEDEELVREFVALRDDLVGLAPEAGRDAAAEYPGRREPFDPAEADRWRAWSFTLANFDAIATGREEQMIEEREGDRSRSRALGEILNAKVYELQYPDDPNGRCAPIWTTCGRGSITFATGRRRRSFGSRRCSSRPGASPS